MITIKQLKMGTPKVVNGTKQDRGLFSMAGLAADGKPTTSYVYYYNIGSATVRRM